VQRKAQKAQEEGTKVVVKGSFRPELKCVAGVSDVVGAEGKRQNRVNAERERRSRIASNMGSKPRRLPQKSVLGGRSRKDEECSPRASAQETTNRTLQFSQDRAGKMLGDRAALEESRVFYGTDWDTTSGIEPNFSLGDGGEAEPIQEGRLATIRRKN